MRDVEHVVVNNGVLSVNGAAVFSLADGSLQSSGVRRVRLTSQNGEHVDAAQSTAGSAMLADDELFVDAVARGTGGSISSNND